MAGTLAWSAIMAGSAFVWLLWWQRQDATTPTVIAVFAVGAALAFPVALVTMRMIALGRSAETRLAASLGSLAVWTVLGVAFVFSMQYRAYYAQWHEPFPSVPWFFQLAFTGAAAVYQFAVLGMRMFFPLGFVALGAASLWLARQMR